QAQYASTGFFSGRNGTAASPPSLKPTRLPGPAPRSSNITTSSPSLRPAARSAFRLYGTPISQRAPARAGWTRDSVTVPITSAMRMAVALLLVHQTHHEPAHGRVLAAHQLARPGAFVRRQHPVADGRAEAVDRQDRLAVRPAVGGQRLHHEQAPAVHAGVLHRGDRVAEDVADLHESSATDETRVKHGQKRGVSYPCFVRVSSVAPPTGFAYSLPCSTAAAA